MKKDYTKMREERQKAKSASEEEPIPGVVSDEEMIRLDLYEVTNCEKLNLRTAPTTVADVVKVLDKGTRLRELEPRRQVPPLTSGNAFVHVRLENDPGTEGYCMEVYLKRVSED